MNGVLGEGKVGRLLDVGMGMLINGGMNGLLDGKKGGDGIMVRKRDESLLAGVNERMEGWANGLINPLLTVT